MIEGSCAARPDPDVEKGKVLQKKKGFCAWKQSWDGLFSSPNEEEFITQHPEAGYAYNFPKNLWFGLHFRGTTLEKDYRRHLYKLHIPGARNILFLELVFFLVVAILSHFFTRETRAIGFGLQFVKTLIALVFLMCFWKSKWLHLDSRILLIQIVLSIQGALVFSLFNFDTMFDFHRNMKWLGHSLFAVLFFAMYRFLTYRQLAVSYLVTLVFTTVIVILKEVNGGSSFIGFVGFFFLGVALNTGSYFLEKQSRRSFLLEWLLVEEQAQYERLLHSMIPQPITVELKKNPGALVGSSFESATVMFVEVVGFSKMASVIDPEELIQPLNNIYSMFDDLVGDCKEEPVLKVENISETYMVCANVLIPNPRHAFSLVNLALRMKESVKKIPAWRGSSVVLRIGLNTGPVAAGIVGSKKFAYHLFGDTVNTASRMECNAPENEIQLSKSTYKLVKHEFIIQKRGKIFIKGKGNMDTYLVQRKREGTENLRSEISPQNESLNSQETNHLETVSELEVEPVSRQGSNCDTPKEGRLHSIHAQLRRSEIGNELAPLERRQKKMKKRLWELFQYRDEERNRNLKFGRNYHWFTIAFKTPHERMEDPFLRDFYGRNLLRITTISLLLLLLLFNSPSIGIMGSMASTFMVLALLLLFLSSILGGTKEFKEMWFNYCQIIIAGTLLISGVGLSLRGFSVNLSDKNDEHGIFEPKFRIAKSLLYVCVTHLFNARFCYGFGFIVADLVVYLTLVIVQRNELPAFDVIVTVLLSMFFSTIALAYSRRREIDERRRFILETELKKEMRENKSLLKEMLPDHIARQWMQGNQFIAHTYENSTVLFSDIVGFTSTASTMTPHELLLFLNSLYSAFDKLLQQFDVQKIDTIGDAYVVTSHLFGNNSDENQVAKNANSIVQMGLAMQEEVNKITTPDGAHIQMRIGIHTGPLQAGVIGQRNFRFNVWGKTAIIANKLESLCTPQGVQMSSFTWDSLLGHKANYIVSETKEVQINDMGTFKTYLLLPKMQTWKPPQRTKSKKDTKSSIVM